MPRFNAHPGMACVVGEWEAQRIEEGVRSVLTESAVLTPDLGGTAMTAQVVAEIIRRMPA